MKQLTATEGMYRHRPIKLGIMQKLFRHRESLIPQFLTFRSPDLGVREFVKLSSSSVEETGLKQTRPGLRQVHKVFRPRNDHIIPTQLNKNHQQPFSVVPTTTTSAPFKEIEHSASNSFILLDDVDEEEDGDNAENDNNVSEYNE
jgi:hypothetical protein